MKTIHDICEKYNIKNYTINDDGSIDVDGNVDLWNKKLTELPIIFNRVTGNFNCGYNKLTTLKGSPSWIGGWFSCYNNRLTSLEFSPDYVGGYFYTSLEQDGLTKYNYNEWRKLYKRKKILNDIFNM